MVVIRRPFVAYDVDCFFGVGLIALAAAVYAFFVVPAFAEHHARAQQTARIRSDQMLFAGRQQLLQRYAAKTERLREAIASREAIAPRLEDLNNVINAIVSIAADCGLEVTSVVPERSKQPDGREVCDVQLAATSASNDLVRFLDRLAREHPYHALQQLTVTGRKDKDALCDLTVRIRLYLLQNAPPAAKEHTDG